MGITREADPALSRASGGFISQSAVSQQPTFVITLQSFASFVAYNFSTGFVFLVKLVC